MKHSDKDIQAAKKFADKFEFTKEAFAGRYGFLAGCEHKQKEVDELVEGLQQALRFVKSSREDYDELQELIQKYKR